MRVLIFIFLFILTGCPNNKSNAYPYSEYMNKEAIIQEYLQYKETAIESTSEPLSEEQESIRSSLVPIEDLFKNLPKTAESGQESVLTASDVDLRSRDTSIKNQGQYGYCTAYGTVAALENTINKTGRVSGLDLSEWHLWSLYQKPSAAEVLKAITTNYICDERYYPTNGKQSSECSKTAHVRLTEYRTTGYNNLAAIQAGLNRGNVLTIALVVPKELLRCKAVTNPNSTFEKTGHEMMIAGIIDDPRLKAPLLILKNSWKSSCHDGGYVYYPFELCTKQGGGCWAWEFIKAEK